MTARVHLSLAVRDLDASVAFYAALFGRPPAKRRDDYANWRLDDPGLMLSLVTGSETGPRGDEHMGVELDDLDALSRLQGEIEGRGLAVRPERSAVCCYATAEKFWVTDPDGNPWEFWVKTGEADVMHAAPEACCAPEAKPVEAAPEKKSGGCCG